MTTVDLDAIRARLGAAVAAWSEASGDPNDVWPQQASAADVPVLLDLVAGLRQELDEARALASMCSCGTSPMTYEGPEPDCPVHGAVRAYNECSAELALLRPVVEALRPLMEQALRSSAPRTELFQAAINAWVDFRSATPDAEPAPGVPVDTEATP